MYQGKSSFISDLEQAQVQTNHLLNPTGLKNAFSFISLLKKESVLSLLKSVNTTVQLSALRKRLQYYTSVT